MGRLVSFITTSLDGYVNDVEGRFDFATPSDEVHAFVALAREQGAEVEDTLYAGMIHGFWRRPAEFDAATEALDEAARWLDGLG